MCTICWTQLLLTISLSCTRRTSSGGCGNGCHCLRRMYYYKERILFTYKQRTQRIYMTMLLVLSDGMNNLPVIPGVDTVDSLIFLLGMAGGSWAVRLPPRRVILYKLVSEGVVESADL